MEPAPVRWVMPGAFCKHCVAGDRKADGDAGPDEVRAYLAERPHAEPVELVLDALDRDPVLRDRLQLDMAAQADEPAEALAAAIDDAAFVGEHVRWDDAWAYAERLDAALDALERRLVCGHADVVVGLAEQFATAVEAQLEYVDDSSGVVGSTLARAEALHLAACEQVPPDPVGLAERLFVLETTTELFADSLDTYAAVLGDDGRARYAELAQAAWATGRPS